MSDDLKTSLHYMMDSQPMQIERRVHFCGVPDDQMDEDELRWALRHLKWQIDTGMTTLFTVPPPYTGREKGNWS